MGGCSLTIYVWNTKKKFTIFKAKFIKNNNYILTRIRNHNKLLVSTESNLGCVLKKFNYFVKQGDIL